MSATYVIVSDWHEVDQELDRLMLMPTPKMHALLNGVLSVVYAQTNAATHVRTGSLKSSEKKEKIAEEGADWAGQVRFGGPSAGVNNPVDYAIYERARGGAHDFLLPAILSEPEWVEAIKTGLKP